MREMMEMAEVNMDYPSRGDSSEEEEKYSEEEED